MRFLNPDGTPHKELNESIAAQSRIIRGWRSSHQQKSEALFERGKLLHSAGAVDNAIADYTRAMKIGGLQPATHADVLLRRGEAHYHSGEPDLALADFASVIDSPDASRLLRGHAHSMRGLILYHQGDFGNALSALTAAAEDWETEQEKWPHIVLFRGGVLNALGRPEEALADCEKVLGTKDIPDKLRAGCLTAIAFIRFETYGDIFGLVENATKAFELDSTEINVRGNYGIAKLFSGEPEEALKHYLPAIAEMSYQSGIDADIRAIEKHRGLVPAKCTEALEEILAALRAQKEDLRLI